MLRAPGSTGARPLRFRLAVGLEFFQYALHFVGVEQVRLSHL